MRTNFVPFNILIDGQRVTIKSREQAAKGIAVIDAQLVTIKDMKQRCTKAEEAFAVIDRHLANAAAIYTALMLENEERQMAELVKSISEKRKVLANAN